MKRPLGVLGVLFTCFSTAFPTMAQQVSVESFETGRTLLRKCDGDDANRLRCQSYVEGVADAMRLEQAYRRTFFGTRVCINQNVLGPEVRDIVVRWMKEYPEQQRLPAPQLIALALFKAFPCLR